MRLARVVIRGYRSIHSEVVIHVERDVTVLLGPNDHGKTNILNAIGHLNPDKPFDVDSDLNWDHREQPSEFPCITFALVLDDTERAQIAELWNAASDTTVPEHTDTPEFTRSYRTTDVPQTLTAETKSVYANRTYECGEVPLSVLEAFASDNLPRVETIRPQENIPDAVGDGDLQSESHEFMRGILYYAGIDPDNAGPLFNQNNATMRQLRKASERLNRELREGWSQGKDLEYELSHQSADEQILLRIIDPAVDDQFVQASRRSSGFTHFFTLKTVLHARQKDHEANAYIFLFDEPGIYLHPAGQYDLLSVLDAIGKHDQVLYSTHSLFMINKTFPGRHRLIVKDDNGTRIDGKPYIGRWRSAIRELGLSLSGTVLFAQYVVLSEGDSDPMLIQAVFQKLMEWGKASIDLNAFSVIATGESRDTDALIRILTEGSGVPNILVLVDGDDGGKERLKKVERLVRKHKLKTHMLSTGTTIEDHLPGDGSKYIDAVALYVSKISGTHGKKALSSEELQEKLVLEARTVGYLAGDNKPGIAKWVTSKARELAGLDGDPSKLGIAREYVDSLTDAGSDSFTDPELERSVVLLRDVQRKLAIPALREPEQKVMAD